MHRVTDFLNPLNMCCLTSELNPPKRKVLELMSELRRFTNVVEKTVRPAWFELV